DLELLQVAAIRVGAARLARGLLCLDGLGGGVAHGWSGVSCRPGRWVRVPQTLLRRAHAVRFRAQRTDPTQTYLPGDETELRNPTDFFKPLAIDAPEPAREIPFKPSRMIHFLDFSNEKMVAKVPDIAPQVDILLGNLEDAVPLEKKEAARAGLIRVGKEMEMG